VPKEQSCRGFANVATSHLGQRWKEKQPQHKHAAQPKAGIHHLLALRAGISIAATRLI